MLRWGAYTKLSNGAYERQFQNGLVLVNPTANTIGSVSLGGGTYTGSGLTSVSSVSLAPTTGLILLADSSGGTTATPPTNTGAPAISGTASVGSALTASPGSWSGTPAPGYSYQWDQCSTTSLSSCAAISGATASSYTVQSADAGSYLDLVVAATNSAGTAMSTSAETAQIPSVSTSTPPANTSAPTVTGTAKVGSVLTASTGSWSGTPAPSFSYQWDRCSTTSLSSCAAISGATGSTYTVQSADGSSYLDVVVTATSSSGSASAASVLTAQVPVGSFTLGLSQSSRSIGRGQYTWAQVNVKLSGLSTPVALSVSGLPSGATASFNSSSTTYEDMLNIWTSKSTPAGTYHVVVTGTDGGVSHSATFTLTLT